MALGRLTKDPDASLPYKIDWTAWLAGATISQSSWTVPAPLTGSGQSIESGTKTVIMLAGGVAGTTYTVTNRISATDGRVDDRSFELRVVER